MAILAAIFTVAAFLAPQAVGQVPLPSPQLGVTITPTVTTTGLPSSTGPIPSIEPPSLGEPEPEYHGDPAWEPTTTPSPTTTGPIVPAPTVLRTTAPRVPVVSFSLATSAEVPAEAGERDLDALGDDNASASAEDPRPSTSRSLLPGFELPLALGALALIVAILRRR